MVENQLLSFIAEHWLLVTAAVVLLILIFNYERLFGTGIKNTVSAQALVLLINHQNAVIIDVRSRELFHQGHIVNAVNIPLTQLEENLQKLDSYKGKPIVLVDTQTPAINKLSAILKQKDSADIKVLAGGMNSWKESGLPISKE